MKNIEPIDIVFTNGGRRAKKAYNWLLSVEADWAMDVNPFMIQDPDIARKVEGLTFNGVAVSEALMRKYPKNGLQLYFRNETNEKEEIRETEEIDLNELATKGISEVKMIVDEGGIDIAAFIEVEKENKNRKTLIDYLNGIK